MGGSGALPDALVSSIESNGGRVHVGRPVERVLVRNGRATGVVTADGEHWEARRAVLSSAHITQLAGMLDGAEAPAELRAAADSWQPGLTLFAVHLATDANLDLPDAAPGRSPRSPAASARRPACTPSSTPSRAARRTRSIRGCSSSARPSSTPTARRPGRGCRSC